ncbi:MAG: metallophosphoesterase family protein [Gemmatimonadetes bacterium]|jgi:predicted phosphodiesterase|nr:metallophosphoesterase family protein [Gemmatimonadota bacterium]
MKIALISDIHGNSGALECVLRDFQEEHVDQVVCLGDTAADGPHPRTVIEHLRVLNCPVVMGNMDAWLLDPRPMGGSSEDARRGNEIRDWCARQLTQEDLDYIDSIPQTVRLPLSPTDALFCYHGSPRSFDEGIVATTPDDKLEQMLTGCSTPVFAGGHTHTPMMRQFAGSSILNPGSIGAPRVQIEQNAAPRAEYGMLSWAQGHSRLELRSVGVDAGLILEAARESGMPHADWWSQSRYG